VSEIIENVVPRSRMSFYDRAAWYAFITPFATIAIAYAILSVGNNLSLSRLAVDHFDQVVILCSLVTQLINFVFGLVICSNIENHRRKLTILLAALAILASACVGLLFLWGLAISNLGSGC
jgi:hypothetical protein